MEIFVLHILKLNIIAAVIILLVKLLAMLFKGQVSARWKYIIWLLIALSNVKLGYIHVMVVLSICHS